MDDPLPTPPLLLRLTHIATSACGCTPQVHLQAQAQAQPSDLPPDVLCLAHGARASSGAQLVVIALAHPLNSFLMRFSGAWGPDIEEGEYEWGDGSRGQGQTVRTAVCMALTPDLETLLCVTRDGTAYSFAVKTLLKTATRVPEEPSIAQNGWTSHLNPSLVDYTVDPRYARDSDPSSPASLDHKAVSLGSTSVAGDFVPQCCVWWVTKGHLLTAIVAGHVGGSGALSIVDMDGEREIDMLHIPSSPTQSPKAWDTDTGALTRGAVTRLHLHPDPVLDPPPPSSSSSDELGGCPRFLLLELEDGSLHSLCLEAAYEASKPPSRVSSTSSLQGASAALPTPPPTPTRDRPSPSLGQRLAKVGGAMVDASARRLRDPSSPLVSTRDPMPLLLQGLPLPEDTSQSLHNQELGSGSLWERCFLKTVGSPASPLPGAPHQPQINMWPQPEAPAEAGKEDTAHFLLRVVQMDGRLGALRAHATRCWSTTATTDPSVPLASPPEWTLDLELVLSCASSPLGGSSRGDPRRPSHPPRRPALPAFERRPLCTLTLGPSAWAEHLGPLSLQCITSATASDDTLVLSCLPSPPSRTSWLLCYHLPPSLLSSPPPTPTPPTLLRAFQCPSAVPPRPLHWLPPCHPTLHDTLNLATEGFLPWLQPRPSPSPAPLVSVLLLHSPSTLYSVRTFPLTAPPSHRPRMPSELPSPCPGAVLQLLESMADKGRLSDAIHLSTALLQGVTAGQPLPAPLLHMTDIAAADGHMQSLEGRAALAKRCLQWMLQAHSDDALLLAFLRTNRDGDPAQIEEVLLRAGKASMALRASYARGGDERLIATLHRLAQETDLPLSLDDMAWLGQRPHAARALFHVARGGLAANLPPLMRLTVLFQDPCLLVEQGQYEWLLTSLPTLPLPCLCALVRQLLVWLDLGDANWPSDDWQHMWDTQGPTAALQQLHAALLPSAAPVQADASGAAVQQEADSQGNGPSPLPSPRSTTEEGDDGPRVLQLSQLLLFALLLLAKPCLPSPAVLWCRGLSPPVPRCVSRLSPSEALALAAQSLAERVLAQWLDGPDLSARLNPALLLCKAMQADNLGVSALLLEALGRWDRALDLRLAETLRAAPTRTTTSETKVEGEEEETEEERALLLETLLTLVCRHVLRPPPQLLPLPQRLSMLSRVLHTWASLTLPVTGLEALAHHGEAAGGPSHSITLSGVSDSQEKPHPWALHMLHTLLLELLILQPPTSPATGNDGEDGKTADEQEASSDPFSLPWSEAFLIKLCRHAVDYGLEMQEQGVTDRWGTGAALGHDQELRPARREGALLRSFLEQVQGLAHDDPTHVAVSERQLAEAMQATEGRQGGGLMSRGAHMRSQNATTAPAANRKVVVFNCGHVHSVHTLLTRALPELEATLCAPARGARPLPLTAELLRREYEEGTGNAGNGNGGGNGMLHLACPACVAATLLSLNPDSVPKL